MGWDMRTNCKVMIRRRFETDTLEICIVSERDGKYYLAHLKQETYGPELVFDELDPRKTYSYSDPEGSPTLTLPQPLADKFLQAVSEFAMDEGIKPARHERLEGTLAAQSSHLQDMRKLVGGLMEVDLNDASEAKGEKQ